MMQLEQTIARLGLWRLQLLVTNYRCVINKEHWEKRPHYAGSTFSLVLQTILEASIMDVWKMLFGFPDYFWIWLIVGQKKTSLQILHIFKSYHMNLCSFNWRKLRNQFEKTTVIGSWSRARIYDRHHHHPPDEGMNNGPWILIYPMDQELSSYFMAGRTFIIRH